MTQEGNMPIAMGRGAWEWIHDRGMTSPDRLRQQVLQYPRDQLLHKIAHRNTAGWFHWLNSASAEERMWALVGETYLIEIAGISLERGTNARRAKVTDQALDTLINMCHRLGPTDGRLSAEWARKQGSRLIQRQYAFQGDVLHPVMRSLCLFGDDQRFDPVARSPSWWQETLGMPLSFFLEIACSMFLWAIAADGVVPRAELEEWARYKGRYSEILSAVERWLSRPISTLVDECRDDRPGRGLELLHEWPFITIGESFICPSPGTAIRRGGPGLYFLVGKALGDPGGADFQAFASALGARFQEYVGYHLRTLDATVHSAIIYEPGQESVDFIVETPEVLVLVEAKSLAPLRATRAGEFEGSREHRELEKACGQIKRTALAMECGHPRLPKMQGRPLRGLVVTRERFVNLVWPWEAALVGTPYIPTAILAVEQLEQYLPGLSESPACGQDLLDGLSSSASEVVPELPGLSSTRSSFLGEVLEEWQEEVGW